MINTIIYVWMGHQKNRSDKTQQGEHNNAKKGREIKIKTRKAINAKEIFE